MATSVKSGRALKSLTLVEKSPTGITGLDEITLGGLPKGRPTLLCGSAGCGKTLFGMTFLYNGVIRYGEPGVFIAFEEHPGELITNVGSLGYDVPGLIAENKLAIDHIELDGRALIEAGDYDLEALFIRLGYAIDSIGAKRVVIDSIETLFSGLENQAILRSELRRLFEWLKQKGVTAIITGERGEGALTRHGLEEYVADCVILLDNRVHGQLSTRRLRVVKYRGSAHGGDEYPFIIDDQGITVMPVTSSRLAHEASNERVSTGIPDLDEMLGGAGYFKGSSILVSGAAGSGKSTIAAQFANSICASGKRCIIFAMEESPQQIVRNMRSIGLDLQKWIDRKLLRISARRPSLYGLETHLAAMHREVADFDPAAVVVDPMSALMSAGVIDDAHSMLLRLIDFLKARGVTALFTNTSVGLEAVGAQMEMSSLMDTWILLHNRESNGEHNRQLYLLKSRGMQHSNQVREFTLSADGVRLREAYIGPEGMLTGSARIAQQAGEQAAKRAREQEEKRRSRALDRKRREIEARIELLRAELASDEDEAGVMDREYAAREDQLAADRVVMGVSRRAGREPARSAAPARRARRDKE